jgi:hypothetical protein
LGVYNPHTYTSNGTASGNLFTGQIGLQMGNNKMRASPIIMRSFTFEKLNNFQFNVSGSIQKNDIINADQYSYGADAMVNYNGFDLTTELYVLGFDLSSDEEMEAKTGFVRLGYLHKLKNDKFLHPIVTFSGFWGATKLDEQQAARALGLDSGEDQALEIALSYYFNKKVKITMAYTHRWGDQGENPDNVRTNELFYQKGIGYFHRPHYWGIGILAEI